MKKTVLTGWLMVLGFVAWAEDAGLTNPAVSAPTGEMQISATTNAVTNESPPAPIVAETTTTATTPVGSTTTTAQPAYLVSNYRGATDTNHRLGAGLIIGEPTGVSLKYWLNEQMAVDGALGWSTHNHSTLYLHGDLLWHKFNVFDVSPAKLPFYIGVGGLLRFRDHGRSNEAGIRVPVGADYLFNNAPIDVFAEIGPAIDVAPGLHGEVTGGVGIRFWF